MATIATGGIIDPVLGGRFVRPTVITGVMNQSAIVCDEVFGPVLAVMTFTDEAEVIALAQRLPLRPRRRRVDQRRPSGTPRRRFARRRHGLMNSYRHVSYIAPFGGFKQSDYGRDNGLEAIDGYVHTRTFWIELTGATLDPFVIG